MNLYILLATEEYIDLRSGLQFKTDPCYSQNHSNSPSKSNQVRLKTIPVMTFLYVNFETLPCQSKPYRKLIVTCFFNLYSMKLLITLSKHGTLCTSPLLQYSTIHYNTSELQTQDHLKFRWSWVWFQKSNSRPLHYIIGISNATYT